MEEGTGSGLSFTDAAEKVLREQAGSRPMHYTGIVERAIELGYLVTEGQTPERTLSAMIGTENRRRIARGEEPRFVVHGRGYYSLAAPTRGFERELDRHNDRTRDRLREALLDMDPEVFEHLMAQLLSEIGYEDIAVTSYSGDGGIDVVATLSVGGVTKVKTAVQVKRHRSRIGPAVVRELRGSLGAHQRGLIITTSDFTRKAYEESVQPDRAPISLVNGSKLVELMAEHGIGIRRKDVAILTLDREALEGEPEPPGGAPEEDSETVYQPPARRRRKLPSDDRVLSMWPLPGGASGYADTLFRLLEFVSGENPTLERLSDWFRSNFRNVRSAKTTRGYLQVLRGLGLVAFEGEQLTVTAMGAELAAEHSLSVLRQVLVDRILGIRETIDLLEERPASGAEIHKHLIEELSLTWTTTAQTDWRLAWLESVGAIEKTGDTYQLNQ